MMSLEQRSCMRHPLGVAAPAHLATETGLKPFTAWVLNLSGRGAGLALNWPLSAESLVILELKSPALNAYWQVPAWVAWSAPRPGGGWNSGCAFLDGFTADQLADLLQSRP
jgi:hypothetical protein